MQKVTIIKLAFLEPFYNKFSLHWYTNSFSVDNLLHVIMQTTLFSVKERKLE